MSIYRTRHSEISMKGVRNSINEILPNKAPDLIERTKFEQSQTASIIKAINSVENPVKEKHVRNIILGTFYDKSSNLFWQTLNYKVQLRSNPIICWKFCYTFHKLLRDGHPSVVGESFKFSKDLDDLAKLWVHLRQDYGEMIHNYCQLLNYKLKFHKKNQALPGNLVLTDKDLHLVTNDDINNYFQLCCDFFDYIDEILKLQHSIFASMDRNRSNSMTDSGQCKLAPLIMCIQESTNLYDFCVKFLFKLHDNLPSDTLEGHRIRFVKQFKGLKDFYETCKNLQYFKNLITIPDLPNSPPNFRIHTDFQTYTKPVVVLPEQQEDTSLDEEPATNDLLVDLSTNDLFPPIEESPFARESFQNYQNFINEIEYLKAEIDRIRLEHEIEVRGLRDRIKLLENELLSCRSELEQQKIKNNCLEEQIKINSENEKAKEDLELLEKKAVTSEEKFNKMKDLYTKLRDEHVNLLKQDAEVRKQLSSFKESCNHVNNVKKELEQRLDNINEEKIKLEKELNFKLSELNDLKSQSEKQKAELLNSNMKLDSNLNEFHEVKLLFEDKLKEANLNIEKLNNNEKDFKNKIKEIETISEKLKEELDSLKAEKLNLEKKLNNLNDEKLLIEKSYKNNKIKTRDVIINSTIDQSKDIIKESINKFDDPILLNCKSGAEYLLAILNPLTNSLNNLKNNYDVFEKNSDNDNDLINYLNSIYIFASNTGDSLITGKITSLTAADFEKGTELADLCHSAGEISIDLLNSFKTKNINEIKNLSNNFEIKINNIIQIVNDLLPKIHDISKEEIGDLVEQEMHNTTQAIEDAVAKLESLMNKSRSKDTGIKLEVNDKILDACTELMKAIKMLIIKATDLQKEIAAQGRGTSTVKEFYAKNHKWTEGLVSAAKLVGLGANVLIEKADKLVNGNGKLEEIIVCSNEIAASTAQLVVSSNVKAQRESHKRKALIEARNVVSNATANVVASAKSCSQIIDDQNSLDFSNLSLHQSKRLEMEAQVKVLELEKQLETEKRKLYKIRKQHYQLAGESEGWEKSDTNK